MRPLLAIALSVAVLPAIAWQDSVTISRDQTGPAFSSFPVAELYRGTIAKPKFRTKADGKYLSATLTDPTLRPNFAGHFRIVSFRFGDGPLGAFVFDVKNGAIAHLPSAVAQESFFIYDTGCLQLYRRWQNAATGEQDDSSPLSFNVTSELVIVRRCIAPTVEKSYYRWHGGNWHLIKRVSLPPPPPTPVE